MLHAYVHPTFTQDSYWVPTPVWPEGGIAEFLCMGYGEYTGRGGFEWDNVQDPFWTVVMIDAGHGQVWVDGGTEALPLGPGDVWVMRPGAFYHRQESEKYPWRYRWVVLDGARAGEVLAAMGLVPDKVLHRPRLASKSEASFADMRQVLGRPEASLFELAALAWGWVREVGVKSASVETVHAHSGRSSQAVEWLRQHYQKGCTVETAAAALGLSRSGFFRLFRKETGQSPKAYLDQLRLEHARRLLAQGGYQAKEIAQRCGYQDARHFAQAFTRKMGQPPTLWREVAPLAEPSGG